MIFEKVELLIHKELTGVISAAEQQDLNRWLLDESNQRIYNEIKSIWQLTAVAELDLISIDMDDQFSKLQANITPVTKKSTAKPAKVVGMQKKRKASFPWMKLAAGLILLMGAFMVIRTFSAKGVSPLVEHTKVDQVERIDMLDGSTIVMNESSALTFFPQVKSERRLKLKGEAFFDVARDESKPFVIETENAKVTVLGTSFSVKTTSDNETFVSVRSGKVKVASKDGSMHKILTKGQSVNLNDSFSEINTTEDLTLQGFDNLLNFKNTEVSEIFSNLEFKFGKEISWDKTKLQGCELNGQFEGKSLAEILELLETALNLEEVQSSENQVKLIGGQCK